MPSRFSKKLRRSLLKRYDALRERLGLPEAHGWNRSREEGLRRWRANPSANELLYDHPLTANDVVLDLGGYRGDWADRIDRRSSPTIHVFEPVPDFCRAIEQRFAGRANVHVHCCGLADKDQTLELSLEEDASGAWNDSAQSVEGRLKDVADFFTETGIEEVALCKINIEGGEFDLLDRLIETGLVNRIQNIQVQFHTFVPDAESRMRSIQARLSHTHDTTFSYPFVWENWRRRPAASAAA